LTLSHEKKVVNSKTNTWKILKTNRSQEGIPTDMASNPVGATSRSRPQPPGPLQKWIDIQASGVGLWVPIGKKGGL
jgi:hypothetical protein